MKKIFLFLIMSLCMVMCLAGTASAKDMSRRFGVGTDSTLSKYADDGRGVSIVYVVNKFFGIQAILGMNMTKAEVNAELEGATFNTTIVDWNVAVRGLIPIVLSSDVNLTAVVGFGASGRASDGFNSNLEDFAKYNSGFQFGIDLGIRPEWFVSEHFSIHTQIGVGIDIITSNGSALATGLGSDGKARHSSDASGFSMSLFKGADLLGEAGFTFWF